MAMVGICRQGGFAMEILFDLLKLNE
jgi:hypothetical protein